MKKQQTRHHYLYKILETLIVGILACLFLMPVIIMHLKEGGTIPSGPDHWLTCFTLEHQITRLLGENPGGLWDGGYFFPFHKISMLCNEPSWGVSLAVLPIWIIVRDIFFINNFMGLPALILSWISSYWLARKLGSKPIYAFWVGMTFCLSGISIGLIASVYFFWPFFLIPVLAILLLKMFESPKVVWGVLFGIIFGYLGWSSAHLAVMGGSFLLLLGLWKMWHQGIPREHRKSFCIAIFLAVTLPALLYIPMLLVHMQLKRGSVISDQALYATNLANLIFVNQQWERPFHPLNGFAFWRNFQSYARGESPIGLSLTVLFLSGYFFFRLLSDSGKMVRQKMCSLKTIFLYSVPVLFAFFNIFILHMLLKHLPSIRIDTLMTFFYYGLAGGVIIYFRRRFVHALHNEAFFLLLCALFMLSLAFGPYYSDGHGEVIPSPTVIISGLTPGFSGIRASARWGLMVSFCLSLSMGLMLSRSRKGLLKKIGVFLIFSFCVLELSPGFHLDKISLPKLHLWKPRSVDVVLKNLPGDGAVLELASYPVNYALLGPDMYAMLYHKRPIVTGYATVTPPPLLRYLFDPEGGLTSERISELKKFGAQYWVIHLDQWPKTDPFFPKGETKMGGLKKIATLDGGRTLVYEDPEPRVRTNEL